MKKRVLLILVLLFSIGFVLAAEKERIPVKILPSGKEIRLPQQAISSSPVIEENRVIVPKLSSVKKLIFQLKGCKILHKLKDKTSLKCPEDVIIPDAKPDRIFHVHDLEADEHINADDVWNLGYDGTGVLVAILDTGVDDDHIELSDNVVATANFIGGPKSDQDGHGTHVSGIVTANGVYQIDSNYATGVAPGADIIVGKVCGPGGCYESDIMAGIEWAVSQGAKVLSLSLGGGNYGSHCDSDMLAAKVNWAVSQGLVVTVSSGNDGAGVSSPACASGAIAVGSVDKSDVRAGSSNYGSALDIVAPGVSILSTYSCDAVGDCKNYWYAYMSGTSMAAPHVAGAAALILEKNPGYTVDDVKQALYTTAVDLGSAGWDQYHGHGRIDVLGAVLNSECTDNDGDNYYAESNGCDSKPGFLGHDDCNDSDSEKFQLMSNLYKDNDMDGYSDDKNGDGFIDEDDLYHDVCVGDDFVFVDPGFYSDGWVYYPGSNYALESVGKDNDDSIPNPMGESGGVDSGGTSVPEFSSIGLVITLFITILGYIVILKKKK